MYLYNPCEILKLKLTHVLKHSVNSYSVMSNNGWWRHGLWREIMPTFLSNLLQIWDFFPSCLSQNYITIHKYGHKIPKLTLVDCVNEWLAEYVNHIKVRRHYVTMTKCHHSIYIIKQLYQVIFFKYKILSKSGHVNNAVIF